MKQIRITNFVSSLLSSEFNNVKTIEIKDTPFGGGTFGEIYLGQSINGVVSREKQAVKIFFDDNIGSADKSYETINKLQQQIVSQSKLLKQNNHKAIGLVKALCGLPQFSFEGLLNGQKVKGYSANYLDGYVEFNEILEDKLLKKQYRKKELKDHVSLASQLVEGFKLLKEMSFIHADLNGSNFMVDLKNNRLAIIDFDSGAVTQNQNDSPATFGKRNDWLAPEVMSQLTKAAMTNGTPTVNVNLFTDIWSVTIGIHYLLYLSHPFFYLTKITHQSLKKHKWLKIPITDPLIHSNNKKHLPIYNNWVQTHLPEPIRKCFETTLNIGLEKPVMRTTYTQWLLALKSVLEPPKIKQFRVLKYDIALDDQQYAEIEYWVENASQISVDNNIGFLTKNRDTIRVNINKDLTLTLFVKGAFGNTSKKCAVKYFGNLIQVDPLDFSDLRLTKEDLKPLINIDFIFRDLEKLIQTYFQ